MEICRGIWRCWWCRVGVFWSRPGSCFSRIGWLMPTVRFVAPVAVYFAELTACGRPAKTQRSYGMDLLRWFRFLWAAHGGRSPEATCCALHRIAMTQARLHRPARELMQSRQLTGAGGMEALRVLNRRLPDVVYRAMLTDQRQLSPPLLDRGLRPDG